MGGGPHGRRELIIFLTTSSAELLFGLLLVAFWGTTCCSGDALYHEYIPRLVLETGNVKHLGVVWPPLLHVLLIPLVGLGPLYSTGLAGTIINSVATGLACVYLYRLAGGGAMGLAAPLVFMCNGFTLIYGATPMMEQLALASSLAAAYYLKRYLKGGRLSDFLRCSIAVSLGCLTRYELWALALAASAAYLAKERALGLSPRMAFFLLPFSGAMAWLAWNYYYGGDPLLFLHHPMGPQFHAGASGRWYINEEVPLLVSLGHSLAIPASLCMMYAVSGFLLVPAARQVRRLLKARDYKTTFIAGLLLFPAFFHLLLGPLGLSACSLRYFYVSSPGILLLAFLYYKGAPNGARRHAGDFRHTAKLLLTLLAFSYPLHAFALVTGLFPGIYFAAVSEHAVELELIAEAIGDGTVLLGTDKAGWLSVLGGLSPEQICDGYDEGFLEAMEEPWSHVDFVLIERMRPDDPLLLALNELYGGKFYIYRYYHDPGWRAELLEHFEPVLETEHYLLLGPRP